MYTLFKHTDPENKDHVDSVHKRMAAKSMKFMTVNGSTETWCGVFSVSRRTSPQRDSPSAPASGLSSPDPADQATSKDGDSTSGNEKKEPDKYKHFLDPITHAVLKHVMSETIMETIPKIINQMKSAEQVTTSNKESQTNVSRSGSSCSNPVDNSTADPVMETTEQPEKQNNKEAESVSEIVPEQTISLDNNEIDESMERSFPEKIADEMVVEPIQEPDLVFFNQVLNVKPKPKVQYSMIVPPKGSMANIDMERGALIPREASSEGEIMIIESDSTLSAVPNSSSKNSTTPGMLTVSEEERMTRKDCENPEDARVEQVEHMETNADTGHNASVSIEEGRATENNQQAAPVVPREEMDNPNASPASEPINFTEILGSIEWRMAVAAQTRSEREAAVMGLFSKFVPRDLEVIDQRPNENVITEGNDLSANGPEEPTSIRDEQVETRENGMNGARVATKPIDWGGVEVIHQELKNQKSVLPKAVETVKEVQIQTSSKNTVPEVPIKRKRYYKKKKEEKNTRNVQNSRVQQVPGPIMHDPQMHFPHPWQQLRIPPPNPIVNNILHQYMSFPPGNLQAMHLMNPGIFPFGNPHPSQLPSTSNVPQSLPHQADQQVEYQRNDEPNRTTAAQGDRRESQPAVQPEGRIKRRKMYDANHPLVIQRRAEFHAQEFRRWEAERHAQQFQERIVAMSGQFRVPPQQIPDAARFPGMTNHHSLLQRHQEMHGPRLQIVQSVQSSGQVPINTVALASRRNSAVIQNPILHAVSDDDDLIDVSRIINEPPPRLLDLNDPQYYVREDVIREYQRRPPQQIVHRPVGHKEIQGILPLRSSSNQNNVQEEVISPAQNANDVLSDVQSSASVPRDTEAPVLTRKEFNITDPPLQSTSHSFQSTFQPGPSNTEGITDQSSSSAATSESTLPKTMINVFDPSTFKDPLTERMAKRNLYPLSMHLHPYLRKRPNGTDDQEETPRFKRISDVRIRSDQMEKQNRMENSQQSSENGHPVTNQQEDQNAQSSSSGIEMNQNPESSSRPTSRTNDVQQDLHEREIENENRQEVDSLAERTETTRPEPEERIREEKPNFVVNEPEEPEDAVANGTENAESDAAVEQDEDSNNVERVVFGPQPKPPPIILDVITLDETDDEDTPEEEESNPLAGEEGAKRRTVGEEEGNREEERDNNDRQVAPEEGGDGYYLNDGDEDEDTTAHNLRVDHEEEVIEEADEVEQERVIYDDYFENEGELEDNSSQGERESKEERDEQSRMNKQYCLWKRHQMLHANSSFSPQRNKNPRQSVKIEGPKPVGEEDQQQLNMIPQRFAWKKDQQQELMRAYEVNPHPTPDEITVIANRMNVAADRVHTWFNNKRNRIASQLRTQ